MTEAHTPEQGAGRILEIFREHNVPANETFMADPMELAFQKGVFVASDFAPAVRLAVANGWMVAEGAMYRLTPAGFAA